LRRLTIVFTAIVIEARNLIAADAGGTSDPYVEITLPSLKDPKKPKTEKTKAIKKTLNPKWNEKMEL
jgi:Ca2+-dependent lipid-binding protein